MNTVEYNEYKFGTRDEAIISSLRPFLTKLASALVVIITSASYMIFGVTKFTNQISDFENQAARNLITDAEKLDGITNVLSGVTHGQSLGLLLCMTVLPCILLLASYFIYKKKFILDEDEYKRICAELEKRK